MPRKNEGELEVYICDKCGKGYMKATGQIDWYNVIRYPHVCTNCNFQKNLGGEFSVPA
jgi:hypothetical protein